MQHLMALLMDMVVYLKHQHHIIIKTIIWRSFQIQKTRILIREDSIYLYTNNIQLDWTPIEPIIKDIRIDKNQSPIITRIQFPNQLIRTRTFYWFKGFSLDGLTFDHTNVKEHGWSYIVLSHIQRKERL
jgi:hypothetical protein